MAAGWSTVAIFIGGVIVGASSVGGWQWYQESAESKRQLADALKKPAEHVADERRLNRAEGDVRSAQEAVGNAILRHPDIDTVPLPDDVSRMLNAQAAATSAGRREVPSRPVP